MSEQDLLRALEACFKSAKPRKAKPARTIQAACMNAGSAEKRDVRLTEAPNGLTSVVATSIPPGQIAAVRVHFTDCGGALWTWKEVQGGTEVARAVHQDLPASSTSWNLIAVVWGDAGLFEGNPASGSELTVTRVAKAPLT